MKLTKYLAVLCCGTLFAACENPIQDDLNVDNPENYTRIYTVNAVDDASRTHSHSRSNATRRSWSTPT